MKFRKPGTWFVVMPMLVLLSGAAFAAEPFKPQPKDKCPVCGMFVAPYPQWTAEIVFTDGTHAVFDGPKDMLRFYFQVAKYHAGKTARDISGIFVTEYYTTKMMNAKEVFFVWGSDVMGPMGSELVPIRGKREAETFLRDHRGKNVLRFDEITEADIPR